MLGQIGARDFYPKSKLIADKLHETKDRRSLYLFGLLIFAVLQVVVSTCTYSGFNDPPMYGDFEAQRHWMEITTNLPVTNWYVNSSQNNLTYWGLDYPPLTAYHAWFVGKISELLNPSWTELGTSQGVQHDGHKLFMRLSVIATMLIVYAPAVFKMQSIIRENIFHMEFFTLIALCYPGLLFVDNGHFQYNHIALGFSTWSWYLFLTGQNLFGSCVFCLALNFKQMTLYYSLPIFTFLLSKSIQRKGFLKTILNLLKLTFVVLLTFSILWFPFLTDFNLTKQVILRIFPLNRGIFEDKVANFWCCISVIVKVKNLFSNKQLATLSAALTILVHIPSLFALFVSPTRKNLVRSLVISSLSFYLFSFQVHEKSILFSAIPALFLLCDQELSHWTASFLFVSQISMYPLCVKDNIPEILPLFYAYPLFLQYFLQQLNREYQNNFTKMIWRLNVLLSFALCFLHLFANPPRKYPHLFQLFIALFCFIHFVVFWLRVNYVLHKSIWTVKTIEKNKIK